ncbi:MAG: AMP-binding protein, partial [Aquamicrobium sp.]|nr:AMP-binding protein [Aquamicrobium sp.]
MLCYSERPADLNALLADVVARFPDRPATVEGATLTYRAFDAAVAGLAAGLAAHGIGKGDRVGLFLFNRWEFLALVFACARLGAVAVPVGTRQRRAELEFLLADCGVSLLVFDYDLADAVPD